MSYSTEIDFSAAAWFTAFFARQILNMHFPADVDMLKVDVPANATRQTPWQVTRLARQRYYMPVLHARKSWEQPGVVDYVEKADLAERYKGSDVYTLRVQQHVSVTPLSLDLTSRVDLAEMERLLRNSVVK